MVDIACLQCDYQTLLELHRRDPDDEHTWEMLSETRARLETAWLEHAVA